MSYTVLARRYRSTTFDEVIGQDHVARTLKKAIASGRIAHAYLFCGTRGTGKTSTARILAKCLNCQKTDGPTPEPCNQCNSCQGVARGDDIDVIEIDAASNTGVDNVRDIISNAQYRPARSRSKVYIIDEVHMLSKQAFNALLKTMEEPPEHVKFILATTEPEKVLPTILSRCQRYDFRNIPTREIAGHLREICKKEKIKADDAAVLLVAKAGAGSMRDALSLLDRLLSVGEKDLTADMVEQLLGLPKSQLLFDLAQSVGAGDVKSTLKQADAIVNGGLSVDSLLAALVDHLRNLLVLRTCGPDEELVEAPGLSMEDLLNQANQFDPTALAQDITILEELRRQVRQSQAGRALLDATLVRMAMSEQFASIGQLLSRLDGGGPPPRGPARPPGSGVAPKLPAQSPAQAPAQKKNSAEVAAPSSAPPSTTSPQSTVNAPGTIPPLPPGGEGRGEGENARTPAASVREGPAHAPAEPRSPASPPPPLHPVPLPEAGEGAQSTPPAPTIVDVPDDDDDDALPSVGRVWEGPAPSLGAILKKHSAGAPTPPARPAPAVTGSNIEAVSPADLPAVWQAFLALLKEHGPGLHSILSHGRYVGIEDGRAVIRFGPQHETFVKMLDRNGKKDLVRDAIAKVLKQSIGVRFEVDTAAADDASPSTAGNAPPVVPAPTSDRQPPPRPKPADPPPPTAPPIASVKITPELIESIRTAEPLVKALMDELGAQIVKVE